MQAGIRNQMPQGQMFKALKQKNKYQGVIRCRQELWKESQVTNYCNDSTSRKPNSKYMLPPTAWARSCRSGLGNSSGKQHRPSQCWNDKNHGYYPHAGVRCTFCLAPDLNPFRQELWTPNGASHIDLTLAFSFGRSRGRGDSLSLPSLRL